MKEIENRDILHPIRAGLYALAGKMMKHHLWEYHRNDPIRKAGTELHTLIRRIDGLQKVARRKFVSFLQSVEGLRSSTVQNEQLFTLIRRYTRVGSVLDLSEPVLAGTIVKVRRFSIDQEGNEKEWLITDTLNSGPNYYWIADKRGTNGEPLVFSLIFLGDAEEPIISHWLGGPKDFLEEHRFTVIRNPGKILNGRFWDGSRTEIEVYSQGAGSKKRRRKPKKRDWEKIPGKAIPGTPPIPVPIPV